MKNNKNTTKPIKVRSLNMFSIATSILAILSWMSRSVGYMLLWNAVGLPTITYYLALLLTIFCDAINLSALFVRICSYGVGDTQTPKLVCVLDATENSNTVVTIETGSRNG